ncbi:uncharacterized protein METZ01_LOCUS148104 [marine metagenome]|uniref:Uncharacterized protein n=1 Tax=marine metagenome TaxID=408172 RepID=A0A382A167_9ZZZZ
MVTVAEKNGNKQMEKTMLGHSSLATTQVYLSATAGHLEEAINTLD